MAAYYICSGCKRHISMNALSSARNGKCMGCYLSDEKKREAEELKNKAAEELVR